jgi:hypothetical protein
MNIAVKGIRDPGNVDQERVVLTASRVTDVGNYILVAGSSAEKEGDVSSEVRQTFWFPNKVVKPNDIVVVYTKSGTAKEHSNKNGSMSHFFYWGLEEAVWDRDRAAAILLEVKTWEAMAVAGG